MKKYLKSLKTENDQQGMLARKKLTNTESQIRVLEAATNEILKDAKTSINETLHNRKAESNQALARAIQNLIKLEKDISNFKKDLSKNIATSKVGVNQFQSIKVDSVDPLLASAKEECMEATLLHEYLFNGRNIQQSTEPYFKNLETYVGGLCDMCGELLRKARLEIIDESGEAENIRFYYSDIKEIYTHLSTISYSNKSGLRNKLEALQKYINEFEKILYDLSFRN